MAITTIRPTGQLQLAAISAVGAASAAIAANDNSDSTYLIGTSKDAYLQLAMGDITLTATQRVKSCRCRVRDAKDAAGFTAQYTIMNMFNTALGGSTGKFTLVRGGTNITGQSGPIAYVGPGGRTWTQSEVNSVGVYLQWLLDASQVAAFLRVHEVYIDVDINEQPTVSGTPTVTGFTNNVRPTVSWLYFDADGDNQTHYQVKMFDAATYGTSNFSADTSPAAADSTIIADVAGTWTATSDLQAGATYKAYVRVGQDWPGPQGSVWWSTWVPSAAFTVVAVPPPTPTITATLINDGQQYRTLLTITTPLNLLFVDASNFETGLGGWTADTNCTPTWTNTDHAEGVGCMLLTSTAAGNMTAKSGIDLAGDPQVDGGTTYTALASFKAAVSARTCSVGIRWLDITGATIGADVYGTGAADNTSTFTQVSVTTTSPGNAVQARVLVKVAATGAGAEVHKVDMADLHVGSSTVWTPGLYLSQNPGIILERGDRVDVEVGTAENWAHPQVATAGTVRQNQGYGFSVPSATDLLSWSPMDKTITNSGQGGMLHWSPRTAAVTLFKVGTWFYYPDIDYNFPIAPAAQHTFSGWAWCGTGTFTSTPKIEWLNPDGSPNSTTTGTPVVLTTTPQQVVLTGTAPAGAVGARGVFQNDGSVNTADVFFTRFGWGPGTVPVDGREPRGGPLVWTPVRFNPPQLTNFPPGYTNGQVSFISDWEVPPGRPCVYRVRYSTTTTGQVSSPYAYAPLYPAPPTRTILKSVTDPIQSVAVNRRPSMTFKRDEDVQIFHPLGRDGGPVKIRDWVSGRDGDLVAVTLNDNQVAALLPLVEDSGTLLVQYAQGGQAYILVTARQTTEEIRYTAWCDTDGGVVVSNPYRRFAVHTLSYIETTRP